MPPGPPQHPGQPQVPGRPPAGTGPPPQPRSRGVIIGLLTGIVVLVAIVIGGVAFVAGQIFGGDGPPSGGGPRFAQPTNTVRPAQPARIEGALTERGFECFETMAEPSTIRSCYGSAAEGVQINVHIQANHTGEVVHVRVRTNQARIPLQGDLQGDQAQAMRKVLPIVAESLLGSAAQQLPSFELEGERRLKRLPWGIAKFLIHPESGSADFIRDDAPDWPEVPTFEPDPDAVRSALSDEGYECTEHYCTTKANKYDVMLDATTAALSVDITQYDGGPEISDKVLTKHFEALIGQAFDGPKLDEAQQWIADHIDPDNRTAQADIGGIHLELVRTDTAAALTLNTPLD